MKRAVYVAGALAGLAALAFCGRLTQVFAAGLALGGCLGFIASNVLNGRLSRGGEDAVADL